MTKKGETLSIMLAQALLVLSEKILYSFSSFWILGEPKIPNHLSEQANK